MVTQKSLHRARSAHGGSAGAGALTVVAAVLLHEVSELLAGPGSTREPLNLASDETGATDR